ncbi:tetratricopeptide repeat protein [Bacillus sp. B-jedd]|uniref:tetratricopeptide repeat protein n=1 Tax=Bacillus sp. B-jedd TaxID=1476857 RepID=UPI000515673B|nr:tetratricopeptide repeat protein [Bacillus sp. B-jedd]CEG29059.1 Photosystem I assembly protein Ycf3 [Bacillus sp. B-jedd]
MQAEEQLQAQKPKKKNKSEKFTWWQATLLLIGTLVICLGIGYFISDKYLWEGTDSEKIAEQVKFYKEQVKQSPNDPESRVQLGYAYFLGKNYDEAIKQYKTAISLDKNYFDGYLNLSIVYDKQDKTDEALQHAIKATEISPRDYKGHLMKGKSYRKLKMFDEANEALAEADKLNLGNVDTIYEIGLVAENQGKKKEAESIYKEALAYDPTFKPAIKALDRVSSKK